LVWTERVYTSSDTGRPFEVLVKEFPLVDFDECCTSYTWKEDNNADDNDHSSSSFSLCQPWWYSTPHLEESEEWRPHGQGQYYAVPGEPEAVFDERMRRLDDWLRHRKEEKIVLVAHWGIFRHLTNGIEWNNSEAKCLEWTYNATTGETSKVVVS
jgi:broad specificity phosphatase PhoE